MYLYLTNTSSIVVSDSPTDLIPNRSLFVFKLGNISDRAPVVDVSVGSVMSNSEALVASVALIDALEIWFWMKVSMSLGFAASDIESFRVYPVP